MTSLALKSGRLRSLLSHPAMYTVSAPALTVVGAATAVLAPSLLDPVQFGQFVLLSSVFQYASDFDLGLSRLTDRVIALPEDERAQYIIGDLLWARLWIAILLWLGVFALTRAVSGTWQELSMLAATGGLVFMVSNGPVAIYRASSSIGAFTIAALSMQFGMGLPRLGGLLAAGVMGCFATLVVWYTAVAIVSGALLMSNLKAQRAPFSRMLPIIRAGLPLFAFSTLWSVYLLADRWIASLLVTPAETGLFGFGVTIVTAGIGIVGTVAQVHYPKHLAKSDKSRLARETSLLLVLSTVAVVIGVALCRYVVPWLFPAYVTGAPAAGALLLSAIPLSVCAWLTPLAVATASRPWVDGPLMFGISAVVLAVGMIVGAAFGGIAALAWGCLPSAWLLLGLQGRQLTRTDLLAEGSTYQILLRSAIAMALVGAEWLLLFV